MVVLAIVSTGAVGVAAADSGAHLDHEPTNGHSEVGAIDEPSDIGDTDDSDDGGWAVILGVGLVVVLLLSACVIVGVLNYNADDTPRPDSASEFLAYATTATKQAISRAVKTVTTIDYADGGITDSEIQSDLGVAEPSVAESDDSTPGTETATQFQWGPETAARSQSGTDTAAQSRSEAETTAQSQSEPETATQSETAAAGPSQTSSQTTDRELETAFGDRLDKHDINVIELSVTDDEVHLEYATEHTSNDAIDAELVSIATEYAAVADAGLEIDRLNATITDGQFVFAEWHVRTDWAVGYSSESLSKDEFVERVSNTTTLSTDQSV